MEAITEEEKKLYDSLSPELQGLFDKHKWIREQAKGEVEEIEERLLLITDAADIMEAVAELLKIKVNQIREAAREIEQEEKAKEELRW